MLFRSHRGSWNTGRNEIQWGLNADAHTISDCLLQWEYRDSAGYSLPYIPGSLTLFQSQSTTGELSVQRYSGYLQDQIKLGGNNSDIRMNAGLRFNYNTLNKEWLISPRVSMSWEPQGKKDIILRAAAGIYDQPPFYRELRDYKGELNTNIKAQRSLQFVAGADMALNKRERPMRLSSEIYYKKISSLNPYDIDNEIGRAHV